MIYGPAPRIELDDPAQIVRRLGDDFLDWADHAVGCQDIACERCELAITGIGRDTRRGLEALAEAARRIPLPTLRPGRDINEH